MLDLDPTKILADLARQRQEIEDKEARLKLFMELGASLFPESFATLAASTKPAIPNLQSPSVNSNQRKLTVASIPKARKETAKAQITQIAASLMETNGYVQTPDILRGADAVGVHIGASDRLLYVSTILSRNKELFKSDRSMGWSLRNKKPDSAGTLPGFSAADAA